MLLLQSSGLLLLLLAILHVAQGGIGGRTTRNRHAPTFAPNFRLRPNPPVKIPIVGNDDTANGGGIPAWARDAFPPLEVGLPPGAKFNGQLNIPCATDCGDVPRQCQVRRKDICGKGCFCALTPTSAPSFAPTTTGYTFAPTVTGSTNFPTLAAPPPPPTPPAPPSPVAAPTPWWGAPLTPVSVPTVTSIANQPTFLPYSGASWAGGTSQPTSFAPTRSPPTLKPSARSSRLPTPQPTSSRPSTSPTPQPTTQSPTTRPTFKPSSSVLASSTRSPTSSVKSSSSSGSSSTSSLSSGSLAGIIVGALLVFSAIVAMFCIRRSGDKEESIYNRWLSSQVEKLHPSDLAAGGHIQGDNAFSDVDRLSAVVDFADAYGAPGSGRGHHDHSSIGMGNHGMRPNRPGSLMMVPPGPGHRQSAAPGSFAPYFPSADGPGLDPRRMSSPTHPPMRRPTAPGMMHGPGPYPPRAMFPPGPGPGPGGRPMSMFPPGPGPGPGARPSTLRPHSPTSHDDDL